MRVEVTERDREYDGVFKLDRVVLRYERFNGRMSGLVTRLVFERGDSAAVLLYDARTDCVVLIEQFRYPAYVREGANGRLLEIVAGTIDQGLTADAVAHTELVEEAGYSLEALEYLTTFYPSPGACTERIHLYLGQLSGAIRVGPGGGVPGRGEDIRLLQVPLNQALDMVRDGVIRDAKTIIALQYLALKRKEDDAETATPDGT